MNRSEKRTFWACAVGAVIYLVLTMFFLMTSAIILGQTGCGSFQMPNTMQYQKILECSQIVQDCVKNIKMANETGDNLQIAYAAGECGRVWQVEGCTDLATELAKQIEAAK